MASTISGTTTFNMDVDKIIEDAFDHLGGGYVTGIDAKKARRTLNLLLIELQNKNVPLSAFDFITVNVEKGNPNIDLDNDIIDVYETSLVRGGHSSPLKPEGYRWYNRIPDKDQESRPSVYIVDKKYDTVNLKLWPTSDLTDDTLELLVEKKIQDVSASFQKVNLSTRYLPTLVFGLAYRLSLKKNTIPIEVKEQLKRDYMEAMEDAFEEDSERVSLEVNLDGITGYNNK